MQRVFREGRFFFFFFAASVNIAMSESEEKAHKRRRRNIWSWISFNISTSLGSATFHVSPDIILWGSLNSKHQLTNHFWCFDQAGVAPPCDRCDKSIPDVWRQKKKRRRKKVHFWREATKTGTSCRAAQTPHTGRGSRILYCRWRAVRKLTLRRLVCDGPKPAVYRTNYSFVCFISGCDGCGGGFVLKS